MAKAEEEEAMREILNKSATAAVSAASGETSSMASQYQHGNIENIANGNIKQLKWRCENRTSGDSIGNLGNVRGGVRNVKPWLMLVSGNRRRSIRYGVKRWLTLVSSA